MANFITNKPISTTLKEEALINVVENACDLSIRQIRSSSRRQELVIARGILACMLRHDVGCTYERAGELVGRNHSSVIHYEKNFQANVKFYKKYRDTYDLISSEYQASYSDLSMKIMNKQIFQIEQQLDDLKRKQLLLTKNQ